MFPQFGLGLVKASLGLVKARKAIPENYYIKAKGRDLFTSASRQGHCSHDNCRPTEATRGIRLWHASQVGGGDAHAVMRTFGPHLAIRRGLWWRHGSDFGLTKI